MNEPTPERIVRAARRIFALKGFDAATVREITAEAGANLGAITYHFGSKQALYDAVLERAIGPLAVRLGVEAGGPTADAAPGPGGGRPTPRPPGRGSGRRRAEAHPAESPTLDRIDGIVGEFFAHLAANPDLQLLVLQGVVTRRALPEPLQRRLGLVVGLLAEAIRSGQREGSIRPCDPVLTALSLLAQPMYFGLVGRFAPERLQSEAGATPKTEEISAHARAFIRAALIAGTETEHG